MKRKITIVILCLIWVFMDGSAQDVTTVQGVNSEISKNLDLEFVASLFGDSKSIRDFEEKLNDPETRVSNLDLNKDGEVDYLRVVEETVGTAHLIIIQAVLGIDMFQDVATIDVDKGEYGESSVQIVGDESIYGPDYIIEPDYSFIPMILNLLWDALYQSWRSPYYWDYYPSYYNAWPPCDYYHYQMHVYVYVNHHHVYHYNRPRISTTCTSLNTTFRRNDYGRGVLNQSIKKDKGLPDYSKTKVVNKKAIEKTQTATSTGKKVTTSWSTQAQKRGASSLVKDNQVKVVQTKSSWGTNSQSGQLKTVPKKQNTSYQSKSRERTPSNSYNPSPKAPKTVSRNTQSTAPKTSAPKTTYTPKPRNTYKPKPSRVPTSSRSTPAKSRPAPVQKVAKSRPKAAPKPAPRPKPIPKPKVTPAKKSGIKR